MKKTLGIILLTSFVSTSAFAGNQSDAKETPKVDRKVVRVIVKDVKTNANFVKSDTKHLTRVYGSRSAAAKVIKPTKKSGEMPNLFKK